MSGAHGLDKQEAGKRDSNRVVQAIATIKNNHENMDQLKNNGGDKHTDTLRKDAVAGDRTVWMTGSWAGLTDRRVECRSNGQAKVLAALKQLARVDEGLRQARWTRSV